MSCRAETFWTDKHDADRAELQRLEHELRANVQSARHLSGADRALMLEDLDGLKKIIDWLPLLWLEP